MWWGWGRKPEAATEPRKGPPECRYCRQRAVWADAGIMRSIPYFYCRRCKAEVDDRGEVVLPPPPVPDPPDPHTAEDEDRFASERFFFSNH
jgi:hypothetical protein